MESAELIHNILNDVRVELGQQFDKNFERKAFFTNAWARRKLPAGGKGTLMATTGALRRSITSSISGNSLTFSSRRLYSSIHNEGGEIAITRQMQRFFWAMYYKYGGKVKTLKNGRKSGSKGSVRSSEMAEFYKGMALKKIGDKIKIPQRQFLGWHPSLDTVVKAIITKNVTEYFENLKIINK